MSCFSSLQRIVIVGTSSSGKTTLGCLISERLQLPQIDLDDLFWLPHWQHRTEKEFTGLVQEAVAEDCWVISGGNYTRMKEITWSRADLIIWLDLPLSLLLYRGAKRALKNIWYKRSFCNGNYESFRRFFSRESIVFYIIRSYWRRKRCYTKAFADLENKNKPKTIRLKNKKEINDFINQIN